MECKGELKVSISSNYFTTHKCGKHFFFITKNGKISEDLFKIISNEYRPKGLVYSDIAEVYKSEYDDLCRTNTEFLGLYKDTISIFSSLKTILTRVYTNNYKDFCIRVLVREDLLEVILSEVPQEESLDLFFYNEEEDKIYIIKNKAEKYEDDNFKVEEMFVEDEYKTSLDFTKVDNYLSIIYRNTEDTDKSNNIKYNYLKE